MDRGRTTYHRILTAVGAVGVALAILAAPADARAQVTTPRSHVTMLVGGGSWLPERHHPYGWNDAGGRAVLALQLERPFRSSAWNWAVGVAGAIVPGGCADRCAEPGVMLDAAMLRQMVLPGKLTFVYGGGGAGVARFRETRVGPGVRAGIGLGLRHGLRIEGRYQYLIGADDPVAKMLAVGLHAGW